MKIKDIRQFRKWLKLETDNENKDENFIGFSYPYGTDSKNETKARGFFNVYHNQAKDIDTRLSTVLDMAQDSQAIYEFVQNAVDCNSTAFFMFYEDNHFVAINNGDPFNLEGIRAILNFAQSTKTRDENIGKFGVGFKLIHRMVGAGNGLQELTHDYTGPILFSWSNRKQLDDLLYAESVADIQPDGNEDWDKSEASWFFKILLTCVPILPNGLDNHLRDINYIERDDLFTEEEFIGFKNFLKDIWADNQDKFSGEDLNQGSLFYLHLGTDKENKLDEDYSFFKKGIQYSLSFVANLMAKKGLKKIYFKDEDPIIKENIDVSLEPPFFIETSSPEFNEIKSQLKENDKTRNINIVFGYQEFENTANYGQLRLAPNFYKFFPMGKEICGLNFILHSNIFEIEASRREFVQKDKRNIFILEKAAKRIQDQLGKYQNTDIKKFDNIFLSILFSNQPSSQQEWITTSLYTPLLNYITRNCPTINQGEFQHSAYVILKNTDLNIHPKDFGIVNRFWFKWTRSQFDNLKNINGRIDTSYDKIIKQTWNVIDLIKEGNINSIKQWYAIADKEAKNIIHEELLDDWTLVTDIKFWSKIVVVPELVDLVIASNDNKVKYNYIKNYPIIKLNTTQKYSKDSLEFKLLKIAREVITNIAEIESFRTKIFLIDQNGTEHRLNDARDNDKIIFKNNTGKDWELNLSEVVPIYENRSGLLRPIIKQFDEFDLSLHNFFGVGKQKPSDEIYKLLLTHYKTLINVSQFVFIGLYSDEKGRDYFQYFEYSNIKSPDVLDVYMNEKYPFPILYAGYIDGFNPVLSVYPNEWAVDDEKLPLSIRNWIEKDNTDDKLTFLVSKDISINAGESNLVKIRKAFRSEFDATLQHINLVAEKNINLLINTLVWLQSEKSILKSDAQVALIQKLLKVLYSKEKYNMDHPQLYIHNVIEGDVIEYRFLPNDPNDYLLNSDKIAEINKFGISLKQIFEICQKSERQVFDLRNYPENELKDAEWLEIEIFITPDFQKIYNSSWSFDLPFFEDWLYQTGNNVLFYNGRIPRLVSFEDVILKEFIEGNECKDPSSNIIYLNMNPGLEDSEKAEVIVEMIKKMPEDYISYHDKKYLDIAFTSWKEGETPNISKIRKEKLMSVEEYSFQWLKALFDWEYDATIGSHKPYSLKFDKITFYENKLTLGGCSFETIPARVEYQPDPIDLKIIRKKESRHISCNILRYNEFELVLEPIDQKDIAYLNTFKSFEDFKASFRLSGEDILMGSLRDALFGSKAIAPKEGSIVDYLNDNFHESDISFLFGPPGTGKTTKVALDILTTLSYNDFSETQTKILVLTPTNKAADVVIERIVELMTNEKKLIEVASTYYSDDSVSKLIHYCRKLVAQNLYRQIIVRYGNSISTVLQQHEILKSKYTLKEISPTLVLATTVHRLAFDQLAGNQLKDPEIGWTHIIIDEASMVSLPHAVFALLQFAGLHEVTNKAGLLSKFTISGDPYQIQPVGQTPNYIEQGEGLKGWATESVYTMVGLTSFALSHTPVGNFTVRKLLTQYRSVPSIGELFSKYKYDGRIRHFRQKDIREIELGDSMLETINLISFPVFDEDSEAQENIFRIQKYGEYSAYHIYSIVLACELASAIKLQNPNKSISIITPYGTQARLTKEISYAFSNQNPLNHFDVSTIHRCQGDEYDVLILVMNPPKINPYEFSHFNNSNLINVGISRAKESLIIFHPENTKGYSEIQEAIVPLCENLTTKYCSEIETVIFSSNNGHSRAITDFVEVGDFQIFNVFDLKDFTTLGKEYLFFADTRELSQIEKRYANVIVNLSKRTPVINYIEPHLGMIVKGVVTGIHKNNRTAFVKIKNIRSKAVIHNSLVSNSFISDINQVLKIDQKITAKIHEINEMGVTITMKGVKQE